MKKIRLIFLLILSFSAQNINAENWIRSTGNNESHLYTKDTQINELNVKNLSKAFTFNTGHVIERLGIQSAPIFIGDKLIINALENVSAINPENGEIIWQLDLGTIDEMNNPWVTYTVNRGIVFDQLTSKIYRGTNFGVLEIDAITGKLLHIYGEVSSSVAPVIHNNHLLVATSDDGIASFNLETKEKNWQTSFKKGGFGARVWSGFSFDEVSGLAIAVTGSSGGVKGVGRQEPNLQTSVIAVDAVTGEIAWIFQHIDHDVWDLDLVGNPMILDLEINGKNIRSVVALSKTGDILLLDVKTGEPVHKDSYEMIKVPSSNIPREKLSLYQKKFSKPEPFWGTVVDFEKDFSHLDKENLEYVKNKLRFGKSDLYLPPSLNHDIVLYGIHGGAEWYGGAIDFTAKNPSLVVPYNRDPWIIRAYYTDRVSILLDRLVKKYNMYFNKPPANKIKAAWVPWDHAGIEVMELSEKLFTYIPFTPKDKSYEAECASCHRISRRGFYQYEGEGDLIYPPLVGSTLGGKRDFVMNFEKVQSLHESHNIPYKIDKEKHLEIFNYFDKYDNFLLKYGLISSRGFWQVLLDKDGNPATKPPWGGIAKIDLVTGKNVWDIPFGKRVNEQGEIIAIGDRIFGGIMTTGSGLIFATGNPNGSAYAFNSDGEQVWEDVLPFAGSAPPMSYSYKGCQYVVFVATGGRYLDFKDNGDAVEIYKLDSCKSDLIN